MIRVRISLPVKTSEATARISKLAEIAEKPPISNDTTMRNGFLGTFLAAKYAPTMSMMNESMAESSESRF